MRKIKTELIDTYKNLNRISKEALKFGCILSIMLLILSAVIYFKFHDSAGYWRMAELSNEIAETAFGCALSSELAAIFAELLYRRYSG